MTTIRVQPKDMQTVLREQLARPGATPLFVFPSNVAADSWSEWAVRHPEESGVQAVALECFTAWDRFKGAYLAAKVPDRAAIPALLRKLFIRNLIHQNNGPGGPLFKKIIPRDPGDGPAAYAFTDWLAGILPSLQLWHEKYAACPQPGADEEDGDYLALYRSYRAFLDGNGLFEPSWERPALTDGDTPVVLFYPELLEDWADYEDIFAGAANVTAVRLPDEADGQAPAYRFSDSRKELRRLLLNLRHLHHDLRVPWTDIAVHVPDMEAYAPYLRREFARYCVPCNLRSGLPLTRNSAGSLFQQLGDCASGGFSYGAVRALLQNEYVPWKEEYAALKENLIREGSRLRCLCSYTDADGSAVDSWEQSLGAVPTDARELAFYRALKKDVAAICEARSFAGIHAAWMIFRGTYLREQDFTESADRILGRCIAELNDLIDIERTYVARLGLSPGPCYSFFLSEINGKIYKGQESVDGVAVFPYKLAAAANYAYHFVLDASQRNLTVQYRKLSFLNAQKRARLLSKADVNVSRAFIRLYARRGAEYVPFSCAEDTFQGFAIAHTALSVLMEEREGRRVPADGYAELEGGDFLLAEERALAGGTFARQAERLDFSPGMQGAFRAWRARTEGFSALPPYAAQAPLAARIHGLLVRSRNRGHYGLGPQSANAVKLSQSDLKAFYPCPRRWVLAQALGIQEDTLDTRLMQPRDMGTIHHKMLELFMRHYAERSLPLPATRQDGLFPPEQEDAVRGLLSGFARQAAADPRLGLAASALAQAALSSQTEQMVQTALSFLRRLCRAPDKPDEESINATSQLKGFGGFFVRGAERRLSAASGTEGLFYFGSLDCLLYEKGHKERNQYVIIDYKSTSRSLPPSAALVPDADGVLGDFQMPLYVSLAEANDVAAPPEERIEAAYFYAIKDDKRTLCIDEYRGKKRPKRKGEEVPGPDRPAGMAEFKRNVMPAFAAYAQDFLRRVQAGDYEAASVSGNARTYVRTYEHCISCAYRGICRTTFAVGARSLRTRPAASAAATGE